MYESIPKMMDNNHIGKMVLFFVPIPNCLTLPSLLYKNAGFKLCIAANAMINITIETRGTFSLIKFLYIYRLLRKLNSKFFLYL